MFRRIAAQTAQGRTYSRVDGAEFFPGLPITPFCPERRVLLTRTPCLSIQRSHPLRNIEEEGGFLVVKRGRRDNSLHLSGIAFAIYLIVLINFLHFHHTCCLHNPSLACQAGAPVACTTFPPEPHEDGDGPCLACLFYSSFGTALIVLCAVAAALLRSTSISRPSQPEAYPGRSILPSLPPRAPPLANLRRSVPGSDVLAGRNPGLIPTTAACPATGVPYAPFFAGICNSLKFVQI